MSGSDPFYLAIFFVCVLLSAFFSSAETAFISLQRVRVENMISNKVKGVERVASMIKHPEKLISTVLLGNNLVNTAAAAMVTVLAIGIWGEERGVLFSTIFVTVILLIFAETTPKTFATRHAERLAVLFARPVHLVSLLLSPFVIILSWIATTVTKMVGGTPVPRSIVSAEEIRTMISVGSKEGTVREEEAEMLHNIFDFRTCPVREVMVPRPEVVAVEEGSTVGDFLAIYAESPLSRFPVYRGNMDNVVGILWIKDVLMGLAKKTITTESLVDKLARPPYFSPEMKPINEIFAEMREKNYRMSVVIDEFGGTAGIVSLSRLVEEIVGPVGDELALNEKEYEVINENTFQIDGSMRVEEANEELNLGLPEGDYETVAGFVLSLLRHIPRAGETVRYRGLKIEVREMRGPKIETIQLTRDSQPAGSSKEGHAAAKS